MVDEPGVRNYNWGAAACCYFLTGCQRVPITDVSQHPGTTCDAG